MRSYFSKWEVPLLVVFALSACTGENTEDQGQGSFPSFPSSADSSAAQQDCEATGEDFAWRAGSCVSILAERDQSVCEEAADRVWIEGSCVAMTSDEVVQIRCERRGDGSVYREGECLTLEQLNLRSCEARGGTWDGKECRIQGSGPKTFLDYCLDSSISDALKRTVAALAKEGEDCRMASERLQRAAQIHILDRRVSALEPLAGFTQLTHLSLAGNLISRLDSLSGLINLVYLDLGNNLIVDVSPLAKLPLLEKLYLANNFIADASKLAGLSKLKELDLSGNYLGDPNVGVIEGAVAKSETNCPTEGSPAVLADFCAVSSE